MNKVTKKNSGKTFIDNKTIVWEYAGKAILRIPIDEIKLIGEFTNAKGPFEDDWYLVIYNDKSLFYEISMYAENVKEMLDELGKLLQVELYGTLANSAEWKSQIIFPLEYREEILWNLVKISPASIFEKLKSLIGVYKTEVVLTKVADKIISTK